MKIKFLGTSAGWPLPRLGCKCELCSSSNSKDKRLRSSVLVNDSVLIDAGPDTYQKLRPIDPTLIKHVILTHYHADHTLGIWDLGHIYGETGKTKPTLYGTETTFSKISSPLDRQDLVEKTVKFEESLTLDTVEFSNFEVTHTKGTIAVVIKEASKKFIYIPDFKSIPKNNLKYLANTDLLIIDGSSLYKKDETGGHESIETGLKLALDSGAKQVGFTHLGHKSGLHAKLETYVKTSGGEGFFIPYDSLEVTL